MKSNILGLFLSIALICPEGATPLKSTVKTTTKKNLKSGHGNGTLHQERSLKLFNLIQVRTNQFQNYYSDNPLFVSFPGVILLEDNVTVSTEIGRVRAIDRTEKQRRCFYYLNLGSELFSVDTDTGAIRTKSRLDTGPHANLTSYVITIYALFRNETEKSVYREEKEILSFTNSEVECVDIRINVFHGALRGLTHNQSTAVAVNCSSCNNGDHNWIQDPIVSLVLSVFNVILIIIMVIVIIDIIHLKWKHRRMNESPPPPTCVQIAPES